MTAFGGSSTIVRPSSLFSSVPADAKHSASLLRTDEQHGNLLTPSFALSATLSMTTPSYENMSSSELEAFLAEMEPEIRAADRDLREIELLEKKEVTSAGNLADYESLQPRLDALTKAHEEDLHKAAELEQRIARLMDRYATNVRVRLYSCVQHSHCTRWTRFLSFSSRGTTHCAAQKFKSANWRRTTRRAGNSDTHDTQHLWNTNNISPWLDSSQKYCAQMSSCASLPAFNLDRRILNSHSMSASQMRHRRNASEDVPRSAAYVIRLSV